METAGRRLHHQEYDQAERYVVACYNYGQDTPVARDAFDSPTAAQERENYWRSCGYYRVLIFDCGTPAERQGGQA